MNNLELLTTEQRKVYNYIKANNPVMTEDLFERGWVRHAISLVGLDLVKHVGNFYYSLVQ